jgi:hypothetical protein
LESSRKEKGMDRVEAPRAIALDALIKVGILRTWSVERGLGGSGLAHVSDGRQRVWNLELINGQLISVRRACLDSILAVLSAAQEANTLEAMIDYARKVEANG